MPTVDYMDCFPTGPNTIAGRYMRKFWHPVLRAEDLKPGWAKPIRIMGEDFTLYRGDSGKPHVVEFRCPHRQSTLSAGWVEDDCIRCRFHGWKFDASGQCVEQPAEKEAFTEKIRMQLPNGRTSRPHFRLPRRRRCASLAALSGFRERRSVGGDLCPSLQFSQ
jgi:nitrite reductase/ring-hydroxylating ferredoxin subunit